MITESAGVFAISEPILATYLSLDACIEAAHLSPSQQKVIRMLMLGYTQLDIAELEGWAEETVHTLLRRAVGAIVRANNNRWSEMAENKKPKTAEAARRNTWIK